MSIAFKFSIDTELSKTIIIQIYIHIYYIYTHIYIYIYICIYSVYKFNSQYILTPEG